jgi:hypothetical protein
MSGKFDAEKAAQVAAQFLELNGGSQNRYALIKMIYLADRLACARWGHSMTGDDPVSMEHGPVLSRICDLTKGTSGKDAVIWNEHIAPADEEHVVVLKKPFPEKDRLSKTDLKFIDEAFQKLAKLSFSQIKKWSHDLPEYKDVGKGGSEEINEHTRLKAVGLSKLKINDAFREDSEDGLVRAISEKL